MAGTPAKKFNPGFLPEDELIRSFCVRTREFESIVETLRESGGGSNRHTLVIGPRGSGKTTLGLRIAAECRRDPELSSNWFPIPFAEESYEVSTCGEFWLECLGRLAERMPSLGATDLRRSYEDLRTVQDDRLLADRCLGSLMDFANQQGKRLLLLVENLNLMFTQAADRDFGWRLRHTLQIEPRIFVLATATSRFGEIDNPDSALYGLFRVLQLPGLTDQESGTLWESISGRQAETGNVRPLQILTGGNPRLLAIVASFGSSLSVHQLMDNLLDLIDEHTEYFKSSIETLAPQERRVYLALASIWRPATTREIADRSRLSTNHCSALLLRLVNRGTVATAGGTSRRKQYYLTERLFNIYYLLRRPAGARDLVRALIAFMAAFYPKRQWEDIASRMASKIDLADTPHRPLQEQLVREFSHILATQSGVPPVEGPDMVALEIPNLVQKAEELMFRKEYLLAILAFDRVIARCEPNGQPEYVEHAAKAFLHKGVALIRLKRTEDAINVFDALVKKYSADLSPTLREVTVKAFANKGTALARLERTEEALAAFNEVARLAELADTAEIVRVTAVVLFNQGVLLEKLDRLDESLAVYAKLSDSQEAPTPAILEWVARALVNQAGVSISLGRPENAFGPVERVRRLLHDRPESVLADCWTQALMIQAVALRELGQGEDTLAIYDEIVNRFATCDGPEAIDRVTFALLHKGAQLAELERYVEAIQAYDDLVERCSETSSPDQTERWATGLVNKVHALAQLGKNNEALEACEAALAQIEMSDSTELVPVLEQALFNQAALQLCTERYGAAIQAVNRLLQRPPTEAKQEWFAHWIRADAYWQSGNEPACSNDVASVIALLPDIPSALEDGIVCLKDFAIRLGPARMLDLIEGSPAEALLLPFSTALRRELGIETRVAQEVEEVARDIQAELASFYSERNRGRLDP